MILYRRAEEYSMGHKYTDIENKVEQVRELEAVAQRRAQLVVEERKLRQQMENIVGQINNLRAEIAELDALVANDAGEDSSE